MDADTFNLAASIASIILAIVAVWQAVYFYSQGKNTESRVETALSSIKAQVETLQSINGRTLDRLTKYVTSPREDVANQAAQVLSTTLRELPAIFLQLQPPAPNANEAAMRSELVMAYIALWNYTATTNVWASFSLPSAQDFDEGLQYHSLMKYIIDRSAADFTHMTGVVNQLSNEQIASSSYRHLYDEVQQHLLPLVGDTAQHFSRQAKVHGA